ncbi:hypothetical protein [Streptomyces sp. NPDC001380]|uniref:hypothetical protein n=1 Tax=Streptomyces sp. NPDC001380 TaxID=3364566 RepID=UPI0036789F9F
MTLTPWESLAREVDAAGGVKLRTVRELLALADAGAAKVHVVDGIARNLAAQGIEHLPPTIPRNGARKILLYRRHSWQFGPFAALIRTCAAEDSAPSDVDNAVTNLSYTGKVAQ